MRFRYAARDPSSLLIAIHVRIHTHTYINILCGSRRRVIAAVAAARRRVLSPSTATGRRNRTTTHAETRRTDPRPTHGLQTGHRRLLYHRPAHRQRQLCRGPVGHAPAGQERGKWHRRGGGGGDDGRGREWCVFSLANHQITREKHRCTHTVPTATYTPFPSPLSFDDDVRAARTQAHRNTIACV